MDIKIVFLNKKKLLKHFKHLYAQRYDLYTEELVFEEEEKIIKGIVEANINLEFKQIEKTVGHLKHLEVKIFKQDNNLFVYCISK